MAQVTYKVKTSDNTLASVSLLDNAAIEKSGAIKVHTPWSITVDVPLGRHLYIFACRLSPKKGWISTEIIYDNLTVEGAVTEAGVKTSVFCRAYLDETGQAKSF